MEKNTKGELIVNKKLGEVLQNIIDIDSRENVIKHAAQNFGWTSPSRLELKTLTVDDLCTALYVGFEIQETQEEAISRIFASTLDKQQFEDFEVRLLMAKMLDAVGINTPYNYGFPKDK